MAAPCRRTFSTLLRLAETVPFQCPTGFPTPGSKIYALTVCCMLGFRGFIAELGQFWRIRLLTSTTSNHHNDDNGSSSHDNKSKKPPNILKKARTPTGKLDDPVDLQYDQYTPAQDYRYEPFPNNTNPETGEIDGPRGPEPTRYGDWERKGRCSDF